MTTYHLEHDPRANCSICGHPLADGEAFYFRATHNGTAQTGRWQWCEKHGDHPDEVYG